MSGIYGLAYGKGAPGVRPLDGRFAVRATALGEVLVRADEEWPAVDAEEAEAAAQLEKERQAVLEEALAAQGAFLRRLRGRSPRLRLRRRSTCRCLPAPHARRSAFLPGHSLLQANDCSNSGRASALWCAVARQ